MGHDPAVLRIHQTPVNTKVVVPRVVFGGHRRHRVRWANKQIMVLHQGTKEVIHLDSFFEAARRTGPEPSDDLLARVMADAAVHQPDASHDVERQPLGPRGILDMLGGWPTLGGLLTATVAGVWIGFSQPMGLEPLDLVGLGDAVVSQDAFGTGYDDISWADG